MNRFSIIFSICTAHNGVSVKVKKGSCDFISLLHVKTCLYFVLCDVILCFIIVFKQAFPFDGYIICVD